MSYQSQHEFDRDLQKFQQEVNENTHELMEKVQEKRQLQDEIGKDTHQIQEDKNRIAHLDPEIRKLESEKIKIQRELQEIEQHNRQNINDHVSDKSKMIRPLNH
jgi:chromosome segregation ATPase